MNRNNLEFLVFYMCAYEKKNTLNINIFDNQEMAANSTEVSSVARPVGSSFTQDIVFPKTGFFFLSFRGKTSRT